MSQAISTTSTIKYIGLVNAINFLTLIFKLVSWHYKLGDLRDQYEILYYLGLFLETYTSFERPEIGLKFLLLRLLIYAVGTPLAAHFHTNYDLLKRGTIRDKGTQF